MHFMFVPRLLCTYTPHPNHTDKNKYTQLDATLELYHPIPSHRATSNHASILLAGYERAQKCKWMRPRTLGVRNVPLSFRKLLGGKVLSRSPGQENAIITVIIVVADCDHCGARYLDWRVDDV
jgi:hypothetical protein